MSHSHSCRHQRVRASPVIKDEHASSPTVDPQPPSFPNSLGLSGTHLKQPASQFLLLLTEMQATRKAFRSLRSFTHAARHHPSASELVSDPIVDDDLPTPQKTNLRPHQGVVTLDEIPETPVKEETLSTLPENTSPPGPSSSRRPSSVALSSRETSPNSNQADPLTKPRFLSFNLDPESENPKRLSYSATLSSDPYDANLHVLGRSESLPSGPLNHPSSDTGHQNSTGEAVLDDMKQGKSSGSSNHSPRLRRSRTLTRQAHRQDTREGRGKDGEDDDAPAASDHTKRRQSKRGKADQVFDLEKVREQSESPAIKRRRTRSSTRRGRHSSPSPEVNELLLRQLVDTATAEERQEILAAAESRSGRRKLYKLLEHNKSADSSQRKNEPRSSQNDGDVEWLGTAYDGVEEVALTPSPKSKRKSRHSRLTRSAEMDRNQKEKGSARVERIDTSESPERVMRRRSGRLNRNSDQASARRGTARGAEQIESSPSSPSPGPKRRRSRRLARVEQLPPSDESFEEDDSEKSDTSGGSDIDSLRHGKRTPNRSNRRTRSRPLPRPEAGSLSERLEKRIPLTSRKRMIAIKRKQRSSTAGRHGTDREREDSGLRRSKRVRKTRASKRSVIDLDADDEVLEEGSADDMKEDYEMNYSDMENPDEMGDEDEDGEEEDEEEDEEDDELRLETMEEDDDDEDDEDDDDEEHDWKEDLKRKQVKRRGRRSVRRKRTQPRDVFGTKGEFLTAREQKERLDFLVEQSAEIANHLHKAMGEASKKPPGASEDVGGTKGDVGDNSGNASSGTTRKEEAFVPPSGSGCELQPHQKEGVDWLLTLDSQGLNAILADEMGLGKTIQAVSFLASLVISGSRGPHLVVAPKNVCQHWGDEVRKWYPKELNVVIYLGNADERLEELKYILEEDNFDILVTSFDHALRDLFTRKRRDNLSWEHVQVLRAFRKVEFEYLIVDEAHRLKNDASKINVAIRGYDLAQRRLLLTGTPLSNNLQELWSLMNVLNPRIFSSKATFEAWFSAPFASKTKKRAKVSLTHSEQSVIVDRLHTVIRPFFRRRVRADVCPSFTSADEVIVRCPLSTLQRAVLFHLQRRAKAREAGITNVIMGMRSASNHPYIFSAALYESFCPDAPERMVASSGKFAFLHYALPRLISNGHRVLIFSQFKRVLDFIEDLLVLLKYKFGRLDGATSSDDRTNGLIEFNREGSDIPIFLLTTRAGGVGLNLQTADTVILFDSDWNPSADLQAVSRIQRIGQKKTVHILRLVTENSIDDLIVETARQKLRTQNVAVGAGKFNTSKGATLDSRMRQKDLEELLVRLELQNYTEDQDGKVQDTSHENGSPESLAHRDRRFEEWNRQLMRKGEISLRSINSDPIWIDIPTDATDNHIPHWLKTDADLQSAAKALRCNDLSTADRAYEENLQMKLAEGKYSRKDRALRARRTSCVIYISDADSENESDGGDESDGRDPSVKSECLDEQEDELDHIIPDSEVEQETKPRKDRKSGKGIVQGWAGKIAPHGQQGPALTALASNGSSREFATSTSVGHTLNTGADTNQGTTPVQSHTQRSVTEVAGGTKGTSGGFLNFWGVPSPFGNSTSQQRPARPIQNRVPLPTAHLKRLPPIRAVPGTLTHAGRVGTEPSRSSATPSQSHAGPRVSVFAQNASVVLIPDSPKPSEKPTVTKSRKISSVVNLVSPTARAVDPLRKQPASNAAVANHGEIARTSLAPNSSVDLWGDLIGIPTEETVSLRCASRKQ